MEGSRSRTKYVLNRRGLGSLQKGELCQRATFLLSLGHRYEIAPPHTLSIEPPKLKPRHLSALIVARAVRQIGFSHIGASLARVRLRNAGHETATERMCSTGGETLIRSGWVLSLTSRKKESAVNASRKFVAREHLVSARRSAAIVRQRRTLGYCWRRA